MKILTKTKMTILMIAVVVISTSAFARHGARRWCDDQVRELQAISFASYRDYKSRNYEDAFNTLYNGLAKMDRVYGSARYKKAFTSLAVKRGMTLSNKILAKLVTSTETNLPDYITPRNPYKTAAFFLSKYYDFIVRVAKNLDTEYFEPGNCSNCKRKGGRYVEDFEERYIEYAKEQVEVTVRSLTTRDSYSSRYVPKGDKEGSMYLTALEYSTKHALNDIWNSELYNQNECMFNDLTKVAESLQTFNSRVSGVMSYSPYYGVRDATNMASEDAFAAIRNSDCRYNRDNSYGMSTIRLDEGRFHVPHGAIRQLHLDGSRYIKKLYVSAVGIGSEGYFDVIVNGRILNDRPLWVPQYDPTYGIDVEEYTSSIEFRSVSGKIRILKVLSYQDGF